MTNKERFESLIRRHFERRPLMKATDVYKLLYQGVFGVGHILGEGARMRLIIEAREQNISEHPDEPLFEEVSANGSVVRVNLRPYIRRGLPLDSLYSAMIASAESSGCPEEFFEAWGTFRELVRSGVLPIDDEELEKLDKELLEEGHRPHHHSDIYREAYSPSYRVVKRSVLKDMLKNQDTRKD